MPVLLFKPEVPEVQEQLLDHHRVNFLGSENGDWAMSDFLVIGGWTGRVKTPVKVLDEMPEEFRIEALERVMLPGRGILEKGQTTLVSKTVISRRAWNEFTNGG